MAYKVRPKGPRRLWLCMAGVRQLIAKTTERPRARASRGKRIGRRRGRDESWDGWNRTVGRFSDLHKIQPGNNPTSSSAGIVAA
jgi:hypothetical protein